MIVWGGWVVVWIVVRWGSGRVDGGGGVGTVKGWCPLLIRMQLLAKTLAFLPTRFNEESGGGPFGRHAHGHFFENPTSNGF